MEKLFERMEVEKLSYAVIENWFREFQKATAQLKDLRENNVFYFDSITNKKANELYNNLVGALWALDTTEYITGELRIKYENELFSMLFN